MDPAANNPLNPTTPAPDPSLPTNTPPQDPAFPGVPEMPQVPTDPVPPAVPGMDVPAPIVPAASDFGSDPAVVPEISPAPASSGFGDQGVQPPFPAPDQSPSAAPAFDSGISTPAVPASAPAWPPSPPSQIPELGGLDSNQSTVGTEPQATSWPSQPENTGTASFGAPVAENALAASNAGQETGSAAATDDFSKLAQVPVVETPAPQVTMAQPESSDFTSDASNVVESAPTDLSHLTNSVGTTEGPAQNVQPENTIASVPAEAAPVSGAGNSKGILKWILIAGVLLVILAVVGAASAYFILGVGRAPAPVASIPAEESFTEPVGAIPTQQPLPSPATSSASFGSLDGATNSAQTTPPAGSASAKPLSAIERLRLSKLTPTP